MAVAYLCLSPSEAFRFSADCRSVETEQDGSRAVAEAPALTHARVEVRDGLHAAAEAALGALPEADCCAVGFQAAAQPQADSVAVAAAGSPEDEPAAQVSSPESPPGERAVAVSSEELPEDGYSRAALAVVPVDDCSRDAYPGIAGVAARGSNQDDCPAEGPPGSGDHCHSEHCGFAEHCGFPEEPGDYQEHPVAERCHSVVQKGCHCQDLPDEERSGCC